MITLLIKQNGYNIMQVVILSAKCFVYPRKSYDLISLADTKTGRCSFSSDSQSYDHTDKTDNNQNTFILEKERN